VVTIFGTTYFTIGAGLIVLALAAPLLLWFSFWLLRPNVEGKPRSTRWLAVGGTTLALLLLTAVGLFWDVYLIGQRAKELCGQTGLLVHRKVASEGFIGSADIETWAAYGFDYVEKDSLGKRYRYKLVGHEAKKARVDTFKSNYALTVIKDATSPDQTIANMIRRKAIQIIEVDSGQVVAELTKFSIANGWLDRTISSVTGFVSNPNVCGPTRQGNVGFNIGLLNANDLVMAAIKPK
jgi:hypothetical protein